MSVDVRNINYGSACIAFAIQRRKRETLEIAVEPDLSVNIAAPLDASIEDIEAKVRKRLAWIIKQQAFFRQFLPRTPERQFVAGETHLYLGRQYRLKIKPGLNDRVRLYRGFIDIETIRPKTTVHIREMLQAWYRTRAQVKFEERLQLCRQRFPSPERVNPNALIVRKLRQRWGSMSPTNRLVLNTRLIEAPIDAIDYVISHELCHMLERNHGPRFLDLLESIYPGWAAQKRKLETLLS